MQVEQLHNARYACCSHPALDELTLRLLRVCCSQACQCSTVQLNGSCKMAGPHACLGSNLFMSPNASRATAVQACGRPPCRTCAKCTALSPCQHVQGAARACTAAAAAAGCSWCAVCARWACRRAGSSAPAALASGSRHFVPLLRAQHSGADEHRAAVCSASGHRGEQGHQHHQQVTGSTQLLPPG